MADLAGRAAVLSQRIWHAPFAFHAPPPSSAPLRKLQHRLHYDHHVEPSRLDLLFLPLWFLMPNLAVAALLVALVFGPQAVASALLDEEKARIAAGFP